MNERFIIFGRSSCPFCTMAIDLCKASSSDYIFLDYVNRPDILEEYKDYYKHDTVPIILSNHVITGQTKKVGGYSDLIAHMK